MAGGRATDLSAAMLNYRRADLVDLLAALVRPPCTTVSPLERKHSQMQDAPQHAVGPVAIAIRRGNVRAGHVP